MENHLESKLENIPSARRDKIVYAIDEMIECEELKRHYHHIKIVVGEMESLIKKDIDCTPETAFDEMENALSYCLKYGTSKEIGKGIGIFAKFICLEEKRKGFI